MSTDFKDFITLQKMSKIKRKLITSNSTLWSIKTHFLRKRDVLYVCHLQLFKSESISHDKLLTFKQSIMKASSCSMI